ncbi:hypothetical protein [Myxosarcina sp. GI1]|uniref:hypothetical protein n=1 Tax=Myxosarcina sp. GI1 TaxID=1541065 RepID=UPI000567DCDC|nr:hypothetical protein [Myxosarcina sp. GI1]
MKTLYFLTLVLGFSSVNLLSPNKTLSSTTIAQLDQLEGVTNVTTSVLDKLGYDCQAASAAAIICKKCSEESSITEKCTAYICDSVTKKCRKKEANLPKLPNSDGGENREPETPSLPNL